MFNGQFWFFPENNEPDHHTLKSNGEDAAGSLFVNASPSPNGRIVKKAKPAGSRKKSAKKTSSLGRYNNSKRTGARRQSLETARKR